MARSVCGPRHAGAGAPVRGYADADSWATDAHKWLNVPYDSGIVFVREPQHLRAPMSRHRRVPRAGESARSLRLHARIFAARARRRGLGRAAIARPRRTGRSRRAHRAATRHALPMVCARAGYAILNDVVINQVARVVRRSPTTTRRVIAAVQADGTCWVGGTVWQGHTAMRISVSSWATTDDDVERSLAAMVRVANEIRRA